jgi:PAS domain S-box-containing protein
MTERKKTTKAPKTNKSAPKRKTSQLASKAASDYAGGIFQTVHEPLVVLNEKLHVITANQSFYDTFKVKPAQTEGQFIYDLGDKQWDIPELRKLLEDILPKNTEFNDFEVTHDFPEIGKKKMVLNARRIFQGIGGTGTILLAIEDTTERKQTEEKLQQASERIPRILESIADAFVSVDQNWRYTHVNHTAAKLLGKTREQMLGNTIWDVFPEAENSQFDEEFHRAVAQNIPVHFEAFFPPHNAWYECHCYPSSEGLSIFFTNINERKEIQKRIENLAKFPSENPNPVLRIANDGVLLYANSASDSFLTEWGCRTGEIVPENWRKTVSEVFSDGSPKKYEIEHADMTFAFMIVPVLDAGYVNLYARDITSRKQAQEERENLLHDMGERVKELTCVYSVAKSIQQCDTLENIFQDVVKIIPPGWHYPEITCARVYFEGSEYVSNSFKETQWKQVSDLIVDGKRCGSVEVYYLEKKPTLDEGPFHKEERNLIDGIARALSEAINRIRAEEQIENLARFPSENPNPVLRILSDGTVLYANKASSIVFETWRCSQGDRIPQPYRQRSIEAFESGEVSEFEFICNNGRIFSVTLAPVVNAGYVNVYGLDVTERKEAEQKIQKLNLELEQRVAERTAELEKVNRKLLQQIEHRRHLEKEILLINERAQRRIGQELHDDVGQLFAGTSLMLKVLQQKVSAVLPEEVSYLEKISKLVEQAMDHTKRISKGLAPMNLDADNLVSLLQELAAGIMDLGICCTVRGDMDVILTDTAIALNLYRIAQEALNNAIKHGKAKTIQIELTRDDSRTTLTVESDGLDFPGMPPESKGMGLKIMQYRSELINGSLDVCRGSNGGTIVTCVVPN